MNMKKTKEDSINEEILKEDSIIYNKELYGKNYHT
jgi:hypothetical protein